MLRCLVRSTDYERKEAYHGARVARHRQRHLPAVRAGSFEAAPEGAQAPDRPGAVPDGPRIRRTHPQ